MPRWVGVPRCDSTKCNPSSDYHSWASWPRKSAAMVTLRATSFFGMMIDFLIWSGESWALRSCEGMTDYRVSSDDRVYQCLLGEFCCKVCLACSWVLTSCNKVLPVAMHIWGTNKRELDVCLLTVCDGSNTL